MRARQVAAFAVILGWASARGVLAAERETITAGFPIEAMAISPNGKLLAVGGQPPSSRRNVVVYDIAGKTKKTLSDVELREMIVDLQFSPDGKWIAVGSHADGVLLKQLDSGKTYMLGEYIQDESETKIRLFDIKDENLHGSWLLCFAFVGNTLVAQLNKWVVALDLGSLKIKRAVKLEDRPSGSNVLFGTNGKVIAWATDGGDVQLVNTESGASIKTLQGVKASALYFSADGKRLWVSVPAQGNDDQPVAIVQSYDLSTFQKVKELSHATKKMYYNVINLAVSPNAKLLATGEAEETTVRLWGLDKDSRAVLIGHSSGPEHFSAITGIVFSPDGKTIYASGGDGTIKVWDVPAK